MTRDSRHEDVSSLDSEAVEISTQDDLIRLLLKGGTIDLRDKEIMLDRFGGTYKPIPPKEFTAALVARKSVTISNGTLSCHGPVFALVARGGAVVHLKNIKIYGAGLGAGDQGTELIVESCEIARAAEHCGAVCTDSGSICLLQSDISECEVAGVLSAGAGSRVSMTGGAIRSSLTSHGAASQAGAWLRLEGVRVIDSQRVGVAVTGEGSVVEISDCLISGSKTSHGVACQNGATITMHNVAVEDCKVAGVLAHGDGSRADVEGGSITRAQSSHAAACQEGAWMRLTDVAISDCPGGAGVISYGVGSQVVVEGGSIRGCACNDVIEREGATATSSGVQIG